jgi:hypothetical protein
MISFCLGLFRTNFNQFGLPGHFDLFMNKFGPSQAFLTISSFLRTISNFFRLINTILYQSGPLWTFKGSFALFWIVSDHFRLF